MVDYMLLIEMQCRAWEHTRVNAGIIELCDRAFPDEKIKVYAEKEHIKELMASVPKTHMGVAAYEIDFADWRFDCYKYRNEYMNLLDSIIRDEPNERNVILLSCNKGIIKAIATISRRYSDKHFYIVLHAALEEVVGSKAVNTRKKWEMILSKIGKTLFSCYYHYRHLGQEYKQTMAECINECTSGNCHFILYAPQYMDYLKNAINKKVLKHFIFLHHPLYSIENAMIQDNDKLIIGIYGQAVNQNAYDIVRCYNEKYDTGQVSFHVIAQDNSDILKLKNVIRLLGKQSVSNKELELARKTFNYILIPYDHDQYKVTASGILCDALSEEIPVLMLDSPLLTFYGDYGIGILCHSIDEMAYKIAEISNKNKNKDEFADKKLDVERYINAEHALKVLVLQENTKTFREMIY